MWPPSPPHSQVHKWRAARGEKGGQMFEDASYRKTVTVTSAGQRSETTQNEAPPKTSVIWCFWWSLHEWPAGCEGEDTPESSLLKAAARLNTEEMTPGGLRRRHLPTPHADWTHWGITSHTWISCLTVSHRPAHLFEGPASDQQTESEADSPL